MSVSQPATTSPLARLVLFMVCLSIAGSAVAAVHYYAIDLPMQRITPPVNGDWPLCSQCSSVCNIPWTIYGVCYNDCMDNCVKG